MFGRRFKTPVFRSSKLEQARRRSQMCVDGIKAIHRGIIRESGNAHEMGLEDAMYSEAGLQRICDAVDYISDPFEMAALAMETIATFHPFVEGNKRTALAVALKFLNDSGYTLPDGFNTSTFVEEVAMGLHDVSEIERWLRKHAIGGFTSRAL